MGTVTTKYSVGDKVYIVDSRGISNEYIRVLLEEIQGIELGSYKSRYKFRILERDERNVYDDLEEAKKEAKKQAKERYEANLELINETRLGSPSVKTT